MPANLNPMRLLRYAVTDPRYYGQTPETVQERVKTLLSKNGADLVCLRDKGADSARYEALAKAFLALKPAFSDTLFFLHTHIHLAKRLNADGVHLPATGLGVVSEAVGAGLKTVVSTHTLQEALTAQSRGAWGVTYSPVFATPGKGAPKGLEKLKEMRDKISVKLIALGGIVSASQIAAVAEAGADGFASIRYFANYLEG